MSFQQVAMRKEEEFQIPEKSVIKQAGDDMAHIPQMPFYHIENIVDNPQDSRESSGSK